MNELKENILLLRRILDRLNLSNIVQAIYIPPAQQLRNQADRIERQEEDVQELKVLIAKLEQSV